MKKFEYKTLEFEASGNFIRTINIDSKKLEEILNEMGEDGWEMIHPVDYAIGYGTTQKVILFFKREKN